MYTHTRAALGSYSGILDILAAPFKAAYSVGKAAVNVAPDVLATIQKAQAYEQQQAGVIPGLPPVASPPFVAPGSTVTYVPPVSESSGVSPVLLLGALGVGAYLLTQKRGRRR